MGKTLHAAISQLASLKPGWALAADTDPAEFLLDVAEEIRRLRSAAIRPYMDGELLMAYDGWCDYGNEMDSFNADREKVAGDVTPVAVYFVKRDQS